MNSQVLFPSFSSCVVANEFRGQAIKHNWVSSLAAQQVKDLGVSLLWHGLNLGPGICAWCGHGQKKNQNKTTTKKNHVAGNLDSQVALLPNHSYFLGTR